MAQPAMPSVRVPSVAGMFYPAAAATLAADIDRLLAEAKAPSGAAPKAIIAPHAGYIYSGPIAASVYAGLKPSRGAIRRVVIFGPAHRLAFRGLALPAASALRTPLGDVPVDQAAVEKLRRHRAVQVIDTAFNGEHCLEVHLPFLQRALDSFAIVPLIVGDASGDDVGAIIDELWGGPETLFVISSDLSHYYPYTAAQKRDAETAAAIERLDDAGLDEESACGRVPIRGLLKVASRRGLTCRRADLRNSGDTAGPRDQVVGYGSWAFAPAQ